MTIVYVDTDLPGITRRKLRGAWAYDDAKGERITDRDEIDRLNAIGLPPAYQDAWLCPSPHGHIQAIGYDDRGRRQYRYHAGFRAAQEAAKYDRCSAFGRALPLLRARVERDLGGAPDDPDTVIAAVVRLLDQNYLRVGNEAYARSNKSFGATTLRNRHARIVGRRLQLEYRAKSGVLRKLSITDRSLSRVVRRVQDLPGQQLFQYRDDEGNVRPVGSSDVNDYIRETMGGDFTAKHFRTWGASVVAYDALAAAAKRGQRVTVKAMLEPVAEALGNTPAIARKSYVHPVLIDLANDGGFSAGSKLPRATRWLKSVERALIILLDEGPAALSKAA